MKSSLTAISVILLSQFSHAGGVSQFPPKTEALIEKYMSPEAAEAARVAHEEYLSADRAYQATMDRVISRQLRLTQELVDAALRESVSKERIAEMEKIIAEMYRINPITMYSEMQFVVTRHRLNPVSVLKRFLYAAKNIGIEKLLTRIGTIEFSDVMIALKGASKLTAVAGIELIIADLAYRAVTWEAQSILNLTLKGVVEPGLHNYATSKGSEGSYLRYMAIQDGSYDSTQSQRRTGGYAETIDVTAKSAN